MVFKSAGNPGTTSNPENFDQNDSLVRVAAADPRTGVFAENYTPGEFLAPGINVKTIASNKRKSTIMAVISANVRGVLASGPTFDVLTGEN